MHVGDTSMDLVDPIYNLSLYQRLMQQYKIHNPRFKGTLKLCIQYRLQICIS